MPNDFIPNHMITDHMGLRIKNAVDDVTRALGGTPTEPVQSSGGNGSSIFIAHLVATYPGEGEDPYIGTYKTDPETGELLSPTAWIDCTYQEILNKVNNGIPVFVLANETMNDTHLHLTIFGVSLITLYDDGNLIDLIPIFRNGPSRLFGAEKKDDYPCLENQNSGGDTPISN